MPVFNGMSHLPRTLNSLRQQHFTDLEIIVVDDGSTDASPEFLRTVDDPRVRVIARAENGGVSVARNQGLHAARGEFVACSAQDDFSEPDRLSIQLQFLESHPQVDFAGSNVQFENEHGVIMSSAAMPETDDELRWHALLDTPMRHSTLMVRREFILRNQLQYDPAIRVASDYDFILKLLRAGRGMNIQTPLVRYGLHDRNNSRVHRDAYFEQGTRLAHLWMQSTFPDLNLSMEEMTAMRRHFAGYSTPGRPASIAEMKLASGALRRIWEGFSTARAQAGPGAASCHSPRPQPPTSFGMPLPLEIPCRL